MLIGVFVLRMDVHWMGKASLFPWYLRGLAKWLGGIPIDRSKTNNTVEQMVGHFRDNENLVIVMTPEGTRDKVSQWKTGFYHIAHGAGCDGSADAGQCVVARGSGGKGRCVLGN